MFNPKENLLEQELLYSGLEMHWGFAALGAIGGLWGAITGHNDAKSNNARNDKIYKEQKELQEKIAKLSNEHNKKLDESDKANYYAMRKYSHETNLINWKRGKEIQDFQYLNQLKQYEKSHKLTTAQLSLNTLAAREGIQAEHQAIKDAFVKYNFDQKDNMLALKKARFDGATDLQEQGIKLEGIRSNQQRANESYQASMLAMESNFALNKEAAMVEGLIREGQAQTGQAGRSQAKTQQSNRANLHRHLMALESELSGQQMQAAIQMEEINSEAELSKLGVGLDVKRIDNAIEEAEQTAQHNQDVSVASMESEIKATEQNIRQISLERMTADVNTYANMMIFPERLTYDPRPTKPPERVFVKRMKAIPGFVPPPQTQNVWAPLITGVSASAGALAGADFSKNFIGN